MIFSDTMKSIPGWYQQKRYDAVRYTLIEEKKIIESMASNAGEKGGYIGSDVIHSLCRMIEICEKEKETKDFYIFYDFVGRSLKKFDGYSEEGVKL